MDYNHKEAMNRILMRHFKTNMMNTLGSHTHEPLFLESENIGEIYENTENDVEIDDATVPFVEEIDEIDEIGGRLGNLNIEVVQDVPTFQIFLDGSISNVNNTSRETFDELADYFEVGNTRPLANKQLVIEAINNKLITKNFPKLPSMWDVNIGKMYLKRVV